MIPLADSAPPPHPDDEAAVYFQVHAWPRWLRLSGAAAQLVGEANILYLVARIVLDILRGEQSAPMATVAAGLVLFSLLPIGLVRLTRRFVIGTVRLEQARLVLVRRQARFEIPFAAVADVLPWRLPLPGPGFTLRMKSGRSFGHGFEAADPAPLLAALTAKSSLGAAAVEHPITRYASARHALARRRWFHLAFKFGLFPLLPTVIVFRLHQFITYGGWLGEYYRLGLGSYLQTFAHYWIAAITALVLYAGFWRSVAEPAAIAATWIAPSRARGVRRATEIACRVVYYLGAPAIILGRILM